MGNLSTSTRIIHLWFEVLIEWIVGMHYIGKADVLYRLLWLQNKDGNFKLTVFQKDDEVVTTDFDLAEFMEMLGEWSILVTQIFFEQDYMKKPIVRSYKDEA